MDTMEDVCLVKIGQSDHKFEWLVGSLHWTMCVWMEEA